MNQMFFLASNSQMLFWLQTAFVVQLSVFFVFVSSCSLRLISNKNSRKSLVYLIRTIGLRLLMTKGCLSSIKRLQQSLVTEDSSQIRLDMVVISSFASQFLRLLSFYIYCTIFQKSLLSFLDMPYTTEVLCSENDFFYCFFTTDIIILMQQQQLLAIQTDIEQVLQTYNLTQLLISTIFQRIIAKVSINERHKPNLNFEVFETEHYDVMYPSNQSITRGNNAIVNNLSGQPRINSFQMNSTPTRTDYQMHNLYSELQRQSVSSFPKYTQHDQKEQKIKKRFIVDSVNKFLVCLARLLQSIHKAYSHLALWRYGKDSKNYVQVMYCKTIKGQIQYLRGQCFNQKKVEQMLSTLVQICGSIEGDLPVYEKYFIKKEEQVLWPSSSQIFKVFKKHC